MCCIKEESDITVSSSSMLELMRVNTRKQKALNLVLCNLILFNDDSFKTFLWRSKFF